MNIPALEANAETIERQIARLEAELDEKRLELQLTRNDIAAARLQAWYRENPGIELAVGDALLATKELCEDFILFKPGQLYTVKEVGLTDTGYDYAMITNGIFSVGYDIDTARRMRQAWLAQEAKS